uniref:Replication-associated protein n=1 Tax=Emberiza rustica CRESS-DNA-virus sp. TaxID=2815032 RepID=A0A8A4XBH0_9VIRU|nr:MAG: putative replication protein [Emberiza rustica CRESS-DNA-virus sp.]
MSRHRGYLFTWNNYPGTYRTQLDGLPVRYIVAGEELAPGTGTPHLQGYLVWSSARTESATRTLLPGCHIIVARGNHAQNDQYCRKTRDGDREPNERVYSRGDLPSDPADRGAVEKARWQAAWDCAVTGDLENIPPDIRLRQYSTIRRIERDFMPGVERLASTCGIWIHGLAGCGKTRSVLDAYPQAYPKPRNQWWDGYQREPVVLLDDVDKFDVRLGGYLKHWADAYPYIAEIKGTSQKIRPSKLIVTSQFTIEQIWEDAETRDALLRRFVVIEKIQGQNIII